MAWDECVNGIPYDVIDEYHEALEYEKSLSYWQNCHSFHVEYEIISDNVNVNNKIKELCVD